MVTSRRTVRGTAFTLFQDRLVWVRDVWSGLEPAGGIGRRGEVQGEHVPVDVGSGGRGGLPRLRGAVVWERPDQGVPAYRGR